MTSAEIARAVDIETHCDGVGEYDSFAELAGTQLVRWGGP